MGYVFRVGVRFRLMAWVRFRVRIRVGVEERVSAKVRLMFRVSGYRLG